tara:strand:- start:648 stop:2705 length:2058 start_codon:yes stop_codon:yes gene_type:complete
MDNNITDMTNEFQEIVRRGNESYDRMRLNWETRYNVWSGQSDDGRKWKSKLGRNPVPFDGASDSRPPLVDTYVNEDVDMLMTSLSSAQVSAFPTESNDAEQASLVTNLLRYQIHNQIKEFNDEAELAANYMLENGVAVVGVFWDVEEQAAVADIDMESINQLAQSAENLSMFPEMILSEDREDEAIALGMLVLPDVKQSKMRKMIRELRSTGATTYPVKMTVKNRPTVVSLRLGEDFFVPLDTTELQDARRCYYKEFVTKEALYDGIESKGYDRKWVEDVVDKTKGKTITMDRNALSARSNSTRREVIFDAKEVYEIVHCYERKLDEDDVQGIYYTCFSPHLPVNERGKETFAFSELMNYDHCQYPFVLFRREWLSRRVDDTRGYGEIGFTWQKQIKNEWDARVDRNSLATMPPLHHPPGRPPTKWGPGTLVPRVRQDDYQYADVPAYNAGSKEIEVSVRETCDRYFGRVTGPENQPYAMMRQQHMVSKWLKNWQRVMEQVLALTQQFASEEFFFRVVGSSKAQMLSASRDDIQGQFDIQLNFAVANLDQQLMQRKLELLKVAVGEFDTQGVVDRAELMQVVFSFIDPVLGERLLMPTETAAQKEIDDEKNVFARLSAGVDEDVREGQSHEMRLQVLQQILESSPSAQQRYQQDEEFKSRVDKRMQQLQFQLQQKQNAVIGRLGA